MTDRPLPGEFDCSECGQHVINAIGETPPFALCATCTHVPGWHLDPVLREKFAPDLPALEPIRELD